jgi:hypothetical protein
LHIQSLDFAISHVGPDYVKRTAMAIGIALKEAQIRERHFPYYRLFFSVDSIGVFCEADPFYLIVGNEPARVPASIAFFPAIKEIKKQAILNQERMKLFYTINILASSTGT